MSTNPEPMKISDSTDSKVTTSTNNLVYVNVPINDASSRITECNTTAAYPNYPYSSTERSFRTLGLITDKTFQAAAAQKCSRNHQDITPVMSNVCSKPVNNVVKPVSEIFNELPTPKKGEVSACAVYLEYKKPIPGVEEGSTR